ncbi:MAG: thioredoxin family protein [Caldilinea sp.]|nr:thioredoxin family protein [Caldilineaceae bacterium]MCB9125214.1 thioredoxin family protein [Caldilineaceae bacterium]MCO5209528.1 thioredoxin family protein [Caldilinea sp.]MCW5843215.1 thioredoxin family protein [Caldilinea sp.]
MFERLVIVAIGVAVAVVAYGAWRLWQRRRLRALQVITAPVHLPATVTGGKPAVLYFTTDDCAQCRLQQAPILAQLQARVDVAVHKLDAIEQEALAQLYGIMTVPTTVVLDTQLRPVAINHGVAPLQKLQAQIGATGGQPPVA